MKQNLIIMAAVGVVLLSSVGVLAHSANSICDPEVDAFCYQSQIADKAEVISEVTMPKLAVPSWMQDADEPQARQVTYTVASKGNVRVDMAEFKAEVASILNSPLGWSRLGVQFREVQRDGQFIVWIAEDKQVPSFSPTGCDAIVSCAVGDNVIINQTRWLNGADAWNGAGGSLTGYRQMVLNHETGHWLGHGHRYCAGAGEPAPVMQQQTYDMQGCKPNSWPQVHELYAPKLGIYS